jgi:hypothetical protein
VKEKIIDLRTSNIQFPRRFDGSALILDERVDARNNLRDGLMPVLDIRHFHEALMD